MPRSGSVQLSNCVVQSLLNSTTRSQVILTIGQYTVTIDKIGKLPDDINPRPGESFDITLAYDPRP